jgi:formyltetrahydrofolate-dependent phosphoribosylglycinamide formyltransferase
VIGVLVSGTGTNLQALLDAELPVVAVAANKRDAQALTRASQLPTASFELGDYDDRAARDTAMADWLQEQGVELVVLAGYMHILTPTFLERFPGRVINVHPSLLPDFPGAHAVADQLAAGVREAGVTVHVVDEGVDTGPILLQERVAVRDGDTVETLHARIKDVEHRLLPQAVEGLLCAR